MAIRSPDGANKEKRSFPVCTGKDTLDNLTHRPEPAKKPFIKPASMLLMLMNSAQKIVCQLKTYNNVTCSFIDK